MIETTKLYIFTSVWITLTLIQGHRSARKQKRLCQLSHTVFSWFAWNVIYVWDLVWWSSYSYYVIHSVFKGESPTDMISLKNLNVDIYSDICGQVSCNFGVMIKSLCSPLWYQFGWPWPSFKVTVKWEIKNFGVCFHTNLSINLDEIWSVATILVCSSLC